MVSPQYVMSMMMMMMMMMLTTMLSQMEMDACIDADVSLSCINT
jgi:hypothetical protein